MNTEPTFTKFVGAYCVGGKGALEFCFVKKPHFIHRFFCRILLGWLWTDYTKEVTR